MNPWGANEDPRSGNTDVFYRGNGHATPPANLFPNAPHTDSSDDSYWRNGVDGRYFGGAPCSTYGSKPPMRYPNSQPCLFVDGHVKFMPFVQTYQGLNDNMWSTDQDTQMPLYWRNGPESH